MASEYYKWLARDVKPEEKKELTPEEKRRNWWEYHKWHVVIAIVCAILVGDLIYDVIDNRRNAPDYYIAYVGQTSLPDDTAAAIEASFASLGEDINGNGEVRVQVLQYHPATAEPTGEILTEQQYSAAYSGTVQLMGDLDAVQSIIFLLEDPAFFQEEYQILARLDGTLPENTPDSGVPLFLRWGDCPVLAALDLGGYILENPETTLEGSNAEVMENMYIARRGFWNEESDPRIEGALHLFALLTEGAR